MTACILHPCQAKDIGIVFDVLNSQIGFGEENSQTGHDETKLSWRLSLDSGLLPEHLKTSARFTYKDDYKKGREGYETRMSWKLQKLKLTGKYTNSWSSQAGKSQQPVILDKWYIIESSYNLSDRPYSGVFISYGSGSRQRNKSAAQVAVYEEALTDVQAKFRFRYDILSFSVGARQYRLQNDVPGIDARKENRLFFNGNLFSEYPVSLQPSFRLNYKTESAPGLTRNLEEMEMGVGLIYKPVQSPYRFSVKTAYENLLVPATNEEKDVLKFAASIDWKPIQNQQGRSSAWTIDYQLKDIRDHINPNARSSDWSISLIWSMPIG
jgi:hypothetical protein